MCIQTDERNPSNAITPINQLDPLDQTDLADPTFMVETSGCVGCARIEMVTPELAGERLRLSSDALLSVVNQGLLPAYDLGGVIRFRAADVDAVVQEFVTS